MAGQKFDWAQMLLPVFPKNGHSRTYTWCFGKLKYTNQNNLEAFALQVQSCVCNNWTSNPVKASYKESCRVGRELFKASL